MQTFIFENPGSVLLYLIVLMLFCTGQSAASFASMLCWLLQDWMQQQQRHKAALETEVKTLRAQIGEACFGFDDGLIELQQQRNAADCELTTVELQQVSLAVFYEQQQFLQAELKKVAQQLSRVHIQLDAKHTLVSDVTQALVKWVPVHCMTALSA